MSGSNKLVEGVFAISKPQSISSAEALRRLQDHFIPSTLFSPLLKRERDARTSENKFQKKRRRDKSIRLKLGHGGTLDPLATGVLICGIGQGTKSLQSFLQCTKSYETVVLFGAATDSYDIVGKRIAVAPYEHVTKAKVEEALGKFRGKVMQRPPIFSALRMDGKRLYEYAREGKELPREIAEREVEVVELELVEWLEGGSHDFKWPEEVAGTPERELAGKVLHLPKEEVEAAEEGGVPLPEDGDAKATEETSNLKRKRDDDDAPEITDAETLTDGKKQKLDPSDITQSTPFMSGALPASTSSSETQPETAESTSKSSAATTIPKQEKGRQGPPAARLRMTVTSGFYVRSLCHDLGAAVGSLGLMASLVRTRQGDFELGKNVLEYEDLDKGEEAWGPQVGGWLEEWMKANGMGDESEGEREDGGDKRGGGKGKWRKTDRRGDWGGGQGQRDGGERQQKRQRRNSSSVEPEE